MGNGHHAHHLVRPDILVKHRPQMDVPEVRKACLCDMPIQLRERALQRVLPGVERNFKVRDLNLFESAVYRERRKQRHGGPVSPYKRRDLDRTKTLQLRQINKAG
jgi:hypothetical protein